MRAKKDGWEVEGTAEEIILLFKISHIRGQITELKVPANLSYPVDDIIGSWRKRTKKKPIHHNDWTAAEERDLRTIYDDFEGKPHYKNLETFAVFSGRTVNGCRAKAYALGLVKRTRPRHKNKKSLGFRFGKMEGKR